MPVTVTVENGTGVTGANSYASVADADAYFLTRPRSTAWTALADADAKAPFLIHATRILDRSFVWIGAKDDALNALEWPRYLENTPETLPALDGASIPQVLKDALFELAITLVASDLTEEPALRGIKRLNVGDGAVEIEADPARETRLVPRWVQDIVALYGVPRQSSGTAKVIRG